MPSHYARAVIYVNEVSQSEAITSNVQVMEDVFGGSGEKAAWALGPESRLWPEFPSGYCSNHVAAEGAKKKKKKKKKNPKKKNYQLNLFTHITTTISNHDIQTSD
jgi:hypothetical protein